MSYGARQVEDEMKLSIVHDISNISFNDLQAEGLGYLDNKEGRGICVTVVWQPHPKDFLFFTYQHTWVRPLEELGKSAGRRGVTLRIKRVTAGMKG